MRSTMILVSTPMVFLLLMMLAGYLRPSEDIGRLTWPWSSLLSELSAEVQLSGFSDAPDGRVEPLANFLVSNVSDASIRRMQETRTKASDAAFLVRATFGPTRKTLAALQATPSVEQWIKDQMQLPAQFHRVYYRERVNPVPPQIMNDKRPGVTRQRCAAGSLWLGFAFTKHDIGKSLTIQRGRVRVDGEFRTDIDRGFSGNGLTAPTSCTNQPPHRWAKCSSNDLETKFKKYCRKGDREWTKNKWCQTFCFELGLGYDGDDCSKGWDSLRSYEGKLCSVEETVGGLVSLSVDGGCLPSIYMRNPGLFSKDSSLVGSSSAVFKSVQPHVYVLSEVVSPCTLKTHMNIGGNVYREDPRTALVENTLQEPTILRGSDFVPRDQFNEKHCRLQPGCVSDMINITLNLDVATLRNFYELTGRYVYRIRSLRTYTSPCGRLARWKLLDCAKSDCAASTLPADTREVLQEALANQRGVLRDIFVDCQDVPVEAVVKVGRYSFFRHVHIMEDNVYDFTEWVDKHPGGPKAITQWTERKYSLAFPWHHSMDRFERSTTQNALPLIGRIGEKVRYLDLPAQLQTSRLAAWLAEGPEDCSAIVEVCGSAGEVANKPELGNRFHFLELTRNDFRDARALQLEGGYVRAPSPDESRINLWTQVALRAEDQLRQRTAWALSQIFVISLEGAFSDMFPKQTEIFANYYDIFVRHAFGNFRDILQEVTYSPVMGDYLSSSGNSAFDFNSFYPDENYAREIMQLFTIGLWKLDVDGTRILDKSGNAIPTYSNFDIMNFARVFTGFRRERPRNNVELAWSGFNYIDPMSMTPKLHDAYPKPDLDGGYLGDGYPLCSDVPAQAFLARGAKFVFLGSKLDETSNDAFTLSSKSKLYMALCGPASTADSCNFMRPVVELETTIPCFETECDLLGVRIVKVLNVFFEFSPPKCVHLFFYNGQMTTDGGDGFGLDRYTRCEDPSLPLAGTACCVGCTDVPPPSFNKPCSETRNWDGRCINGNDWWLSKRFCAKTCFDKGLGYKGEDCSKDFKERHICQYRGEHVPFEEARTRCAKARMSICKNQVKSKLCAHKTRVWTPERCSANLAVYADGTVSSQIDENAKQNKIFVHWDGGFPVPGKCPKGCREQATSCLCSVQPKLSAVVSTQPTQRDLRKMKIGAFPPSTPCDICKGVKVYFGTSRTYDEYTIFEAGGTFYRNAAATVFVGETSFRNPPTFVRRDSPTEKAAKDEVDSLLEHLFRHPNVPVFIARRLIQRFGVSNPSPRYVRGVGNAFRSGRFGKVVNTGAYGDLAATVAAVLLDEEAESVPASTTQGSLREPLIKLIHFLRALEFDDTSGRTLVFTGELNLLFGQAPYWAPSVFNFYKPDYQPVSFSGDNVAPEFEIFTSPNILRFFNGMLSLISNEGLTSCSNGFGVRTQTCLQQSFGLPAKGRAPDFVRNLDILLTGGRLSDNSRGAALSAFNNAEEDVRFQAAQEAVMMSPEFHVLGNPALAERRSATQEVAPTEPASYKAMVLLYLGGGADSFNMLVPMGCSLYRQYAAVRKNLKLRGGELLKITTTGQRCREFGVHHKLPFVRDLYNRNQAAFLSNVGSLLKPLTKAQFERGAGACIGLFSHSDQTLGAQTLQCQFSGAAARGFGGRMADSLAASSGLQTASFSIAGAVPWAQGFKTSATIVDARQGAIRLDDSERLKPVVSKITSFKYKNIYCEEYAHQVSSAISSSERLGKQLDRAKLKTEFQADHILEHQLRQVALVIATREKRKAERDFFYVELGGFDHHAELRESLSQRFQILNAAIEKFVLELKAQGIFDKTVLVTASDFGRSLTSNGQGTDHGWAGNYFVIGGAVRGGRIFNSYPRSLHEGGSQDAGRGRLIPKYPWENVMVPIATWMGVKPRRLSDVFPNLRNFDEAKHILRQDELFK
eukprot:TRINITY_DN1113_c0_g1_i8.p1 TRINITY_DN1113_c0_g1~~TRINITY_DN1113_c0_g1_i8.p1  ORF type:complete len:1938 (+),score=261.64 TRINITY_DN1113_c0_g1_i8:71-5815(+)